MITAILLGALASGGPPPLVGVDLQQAILQSKAGRRAARQRDRVQAEVNARRQALLEKRSSMAPADFEAAVEAFNHFVDQSDARLQSQQEELLGPLTAELEAQVDVLRSRGLRVLDVPKGGLIGLPSACDATAAVSESKAAVFTAPAVCRQRQVVRVDVGRALAGSAAAAKTSQALDQLKAERQAAVDELRRQMAEAEPKERAALEARLDKRFQAFQEEIQRAEEQAERTLRRRLVETIQRSRPSSVVVVLGKEGDPCDATEAAAAALGGASFSEALEESCPTGAEAGAGAN
jgi:hypothetical protein